MSDKIVVDPIHGDIRLSDIERQVIDTSIFQRLRRIKQLQMGHLTYPNATHNRFVHSLGVLKIMKRVIEATRDDLSLNLSDETGQQLRLAALLHDVGHYPYSHLMEGIDKVILTEQFVQDADEKILQASHENYPNHEFLGERIITVRPEMKNILTGPHSGKDIADLFRRNDAADPQLSKLIHSSMDMDRIDYLVRDSRAAGVPYGEIDINYLLNNFRVSPDGMLGLREKALPAAEQLLLARYFMHRTVYFHKTTVGFEEACRQLLRRIRDRGQNGSGGETYGLPIDGSEVIQLVSSDKLLEFDDSFVDRIVQRATNDDDLVIKRLAETIVSRRPPRLLREVSVFCSRNSSIHAGTQFKQACKYELEAIAKRHQLPLGLFLFHETKKIQFEERGKYITHKEGRNLPPESDEEMTRIFIDDQSEPVPIVEIEHSVLSHLSERTFQYFRLYLADPTVDAGTEESLRHEVMQFGNSN